LPEKGDPITIGTPVQALLYYANVEEQGGTLSTLGSRTLAFVGIGPTLEEAEQRAEQSASAVRGRVRYRRDIGTRELLERRIAHMKELR
jgi:phosphoribosylamine--glycine ligase